MREEGETVMTNKIAQSIEEGVKAIKDSKKIYLCSHVQPDGDNIGSLLGLGIALKKLNKEVHIVKVDDIPKKYEFLPNIDLIKKVSTEEMVDLFIALDSSDLERLGVGKKIALRSNSILNIDHHITNENFGDINIVISDASSTGEVVYSIIKELGVTIDKNIATCLYVAISTDTGSFMYDSTTSNTHLIAADLLNKGIDLNYIITNLYQNRSMEKTKLFIESLNTLEFHLDGKVAIIKITRKMLEDCNATMEETEGIVSFIRDIEGVEVASILKEFDDEETKISVRSKKHIDVSEICLKLNGGGHKRAAGCTIYENIENAEKILLDAIFKAFR